MTASRVCALATALVLLTALAMAAGPAPAPAPSNAPVPTEPSFYGDPPDDHHPWAIHDPHRPQPPLVTPGTPSTPDKPGTPPSDAVILFDGKDLSNWLADNGNPTKWVVKDGAMECTPGSGYIKTKDSFGDCQLHVEWAAPSKVQGSSQGRGNSGIFLMGGIEVQVLDNYNNPTYADGFAGSVYGTMPPQANALRPPGEFQVVDIVFRRPVYKDGKPLDPGYVTVFLNGVLVQDHTPLEGNGGHMRRTHAGPMPAKGPLKFQDHGNPVRYRNVWVRPLPPRSVEGSTDGYLTTEATTAKRKEIAAMIRAEAAKRKDANNPLPEMLRLAESLQYEKDDAVLQQVQTMGTAYADGVAKLTGDKLAAKKDEVKRVAGVFGSLSRWKILPADFGPKVALDKLIKEQGWDKR